MARTTTISDAQERALLAYARLTKKNPAPSLVEWADAMGLEYTTVRQHRRNLTTAGLMTFDKNRVRSTRLTDSGRRFVEGR